MCPDGHRMTRWTSCKRRDFIRCLRKLGFVGPFPGAKHEYMSHGHRNLAIPNDPEYKVRKLKMMIVEVEDIIGHEISVDVWNNL